MKMLHKHKLRKMQGKYFSNSHLRYFKKTRNIISLAEHRNGGNQIIETDQRNLF